MRIHILFKHTLKAYKIDQIRTQQILKHEYKLMYIDTSPPIQWSLEIQWEGQRKIEEREVNNKKYNPIYL